ncbi:MAG: hypothetical protein V7724_05280 [Sediminicola sp.]|tara:strand:+ start:22693 stop:22833 length:141 start_codon:yes stop_codon:yes gene_type:complete
MQKGGKGKMDSKKTDQKRLQRDSKVQMALIIIIIVLILALGVILLT